MAREAGVLAKATQPDGTLAAPVLTRLMALVSDAVIRFDSAGVISEANEEARRLLAPIDAEGDRTDLVGTDVRALFAVADDAFDGPFSPECLPLSLDGSACSVDHTSVHGQPLQLIVRCERIAVVPEAYLLVAHAESESSAIESERERLFEELANANRRLVGTLNIILGTLNSPSIPALFERVLEELRDTMGATGAVMYLAGADGFRLQGVSASLEGVSLPRYLSLGNELVATAAESSTTLCLEILPREEGASGDSTVRTVIEQHTQKTYQVAADLLPPFESFLSVPVRFGGRIIAFLGVGWRKARAIPYDDADLLYAVAQYLAIQLVGAVSALKTQRRQELVQQANDLRDAVVAQPPSPERDQMVLETVERDLDCRCVPILDPRSGEGDRVARLSRTGAEEGIPQELIVADRPVTVLTADDALAVWLRERGEYDIGAMVGCDTVDDELLSFLALRPSGSEPFDDLELGYLRQVNETLRAIESGEQGRRRDQQISRALQSGMRNELQEVAGITAEGLYSSATESALVGGDFYSLIRMPGRRACVIMGDVSGKGVEAASVSAAVRTALGAYAWEGLAPTQMVQHLNDLLLGFSHTETFATLFVGIIDLEKGEIRYCSAGHPPALLWHQAVKELEWLGEQSGVVGAFQDMDYRGGRCVLGQGDVLFLYTDGTTEARAADGGFFGEVGLRDAVVSEATRGFEGMVGRIMARVEDFTDHNLNDDVAMVALRFDEVGE